MAYSPRNLLVCSDRRDADQGDTVVLSRSTGATLASLTTLPNAGYGDILTSGILAVTNQQVAGSKLAGVSIFNNDLGLITTVTAQAVANALSWSSPLVAGNRAGHLFYFLAQRIADVFNPTLYTYSDAGVVGGTTWTFSTGGGQARAIAVNLAGTILYWGVANATLGAINRYDLTNSIAMTPLVAATATNFLGTTFVVTADDDLLTAYQTAAGQPWTLNRYNPSGVLQSAIALGVNLWGDEPEVFSDSDPANVWVRTFPDVDGLTSRFRCFVIATGEVVEDWTVDTLAGTGDVPVTCPNIVLRAITPTVERRRIRRVRRFPLPFDRNFWVYVRRIEFLIQAGVGNSNDPGADPQLEVRFSGDGGATWGDILLVPMGRQGEYNLRQVINNIGKLRNGWVEVADSDPVRSYLLACFVDADENET